MAARFYVLYTGPVSGFSLRTLNGLTISIQIRCIRPDEFIWQGVCMYEQDTFDAGARGKQTYPPGLSE